MNAAHRFGRGFFALLIGSCLSSTLVLAADPEPTDPEPTDASLQAQVDELIQAWHNPSFSARQSASQKLEALGPQAFEPLATAATQGDAEVVHRVLEILKRAASQADVQTKTAAKQAIGRIAASSVNSASRAATELRRELDAPRLARRNSATPAARAAFGFNRQPPPQRVAQPVPAFQIFPPQIDNRNGNRGGQFRIQVVPGNRIQVVPDLRGVQPRQRTPRPPIDAPGQAIPAIDPFGAITPR